MKTKIALLSALAVPLTAAVPVVSSARAATPYVIDVVMPLTGGAAFLGKGEQRSLQLAEKVVNASGGIDGAPLHPEVPRSPFPSTQTSRLDVLGVPP